MLDLVRSVDDIGANRIIYRGIFLCSNVSSLMLAPNTSVKSNTTYLLIDNEGTLCEHFQYCIVPCHTLLSGPRVFKKGLKSRRSKRK